MAQPFQGFVLDSRKVQAGQIFIALTSLSQPEKTVQFAEIALDKGALAVVSETELGLENSIVVPNVRHLMGGWQKQFLLATSQVTACSYFSGDRNQW
jgi:UDP-N-acetylmuramoyl-L-alanyl-D-glutamate--2,6-diaminopimelate ligase